MIKITLKDGSLMEVEKETLLIDVAKSISEGLARVCTAAVVNNEVCDLRTPVTTDCTVSFLTFDDEKGRLAYRHQRSKN